jgi:uncharacterized protein (TIGR04255 family)
MSDASGGPDWVALLGMEEPVHFDKAPVGEVICDLQLEKMQWGLLEIGRYYEHIKGRYPEATTKPELPPLDAEMAGGNIRVEMLQTPPVPRAWFIEPGKNCLLQVQSDRFILNWRKLNDESEYPHFLSENGKGVWQRFVREWEIFREFCQDHAGVGRPTPVMCELAYVNHLARGVDWQNAGDLGRLLKPFESASGFRFRPGLASEPNAIQLNMVFELPEDRGRLLLKTYQGKRVSDDKEMIFVELRARGRLPAQASDSDVATWFSTAHKCIVLGFVDMATENGREHWGYVANRGGKEGRQ